MHVVLSFGFAIVAMLMGWRFARTTMSGFVGFCVTVAIASITWNDVKPIAFPLSDFLLLISAPAVLLSLLRDKTRARVPIACAGGAALVGLAILLNAVIPASQSYSEARYAGDPGVPHIAAPSEISRVVTSVTYGLKLEVGLVILPLALMVVAYNRRRLTTLLDLWGISALVNGLVGLSDYFHLTRISVELYAGQATVGVGPGGGRASGLTNHPDHLATVCVMALPIVLCWWRRSPAWRRMSVLSVLVLAVTIFATRSRGGLAAGGLIIVLAVLTQPEVRRAIQPWILPAVCLAGAAVAADTRIVHTLLSHTRFGTLGASGSDEQRLAVARQAVLDIKHRPLLGVGFDVADQGHSIYLQAIASGGVITLVGLFMYIAGVLSGVRIRVANYWRPMETAAVVSVFSWLILGAIENDFADRYPYVPLAMLLAIAAIRAHSADSDSDSDSMPELLNPSAERNGAAPSNGLASAAIESRPRALI